MITTDFIEMEMDDATLHVKKDCRDSFGLLCQEIQELRSRTCTTWLFAKSCIFSSLSLLKPPKIKAEHMLYPLSSFCLKYFLNSSRSWQLCITTYITNQSCRACWLNCPQHRFGSKIHQWVCNCRHHCEISANFFDLLCQHFGFRKSAIFPCFEYSWNNIKMYGSIHCWYRIESINQKKEENS